eukprot:gene3341-2323_t
MVGCGVYLVSTVFGPRIFAVDLFDSFRCVIESRRYFNYSYLVIGSYVLALDAFVVDEVSCSTVFSWIIFSWVCCDDIVVFVDLGCIHFVIVTAACYEDLCCIAERIAVLWIVETLQMASNVNCVTLCFYFGFYFVADTCDSTDGFAGRFCYLVPGCVMFVLYFSGCDLFPNINPFDTVLSPKTLVEFYNDCCIYMCLGFVASDGLVINSLFTTVCMLWVITCVVDRCWLLMMLRCGFHVKVCCLVTLSTQQLYALGKELLASWCTCYFCRLDVVIRRNRSICGA